MQAAEKFFALQNSCDPWKSIWTQEAIRKAETQGWVIRNKVYEKGKKLVLIRIQYWVISNEYVLFYDFIYTASNHVIIMFI